MTSMHVSEHCRPFCSAISRQLDALEDYRTTLMVAFCDIVLLLYLPEC